MTKRVSSTSKPKASAAPKGSGLEVFEFERVKPEKK